MTIKLSHGFKVFSPLLPCLLLGLQVGCSTHSPTASALQRLQGTWQGVDVRGNPDDKYTITITGNAFHFHRDTNFWFATTITLPAGTDPQQLRATIKDCAGEPPKPIGKVVPAIFKIEDGTLNLAAFQDNEAEPPKSFDDEEAMHYELRKVQPQRKNTEASTSK